MPATGKHAMRQGCPSPYRKFSAKNSVNSACGCRRRTIVAPRTCRGRRSMPIGMPALRVRIGLGGDRRQHAEQSTSGTNCSDVKAGG